MVYVCHCELCDCSAGIFKFSARVGYVTKLMPRHNYGTLYYGINNFITADNTVIVTHVKSLCICLSHTAIREACESQLWPNMN